MGLHIYSIYDHPEDFPNDYVIRRFTINGRISAEPIADPDPYFVSEHLDSCRLLMHEKNLVLLPRDADDDPTIIESYI